MREVTNYIAALNRGLELLQELPLSIGRLEEKTMPKGNAAGCTNACPDAYTTTYRYWVAGDTYGGVAQQGFLKSTAQPGDNPVAACGGTEATVCLHYDARGNVVHFLDAKGDHYAGYDLDNRVSRAQARGSVVPPTRTSGSTTP